MTVRRVLLRYSTLIAITEHRRQIPIEISRVRGDAAMSGTWSGSWVNGAYINKIKQYIHQQIEFVKNAPLRSTIGLRVATADRAAFASSMIVSDLIIVYIVDITR